MTITISSVRFRYGKKLALDNLSTTFTPGFNVLLGPNGAGKSTLFNLLTAQKHLQAGELLFDNVDMSDQPSALMRNIGVVFQKPSLDLDLSIKQNLTYFAALHGIAGKQGLANIAHILASLGLSERLHDKIRSLNEGHRRRVELARALLHRPQYLFLDEPTVGLDVHSRQIILEHVRTLAQPGVCVVWTTHLLDEIEPDDHLVIINHGALVADDTCAALYKQHGVASVLSLYRTLTNTQENAL